MLTVHFAAGSMHPYLLAEYPPLFSQVLLTFVLAMCQNWGMEDLPFATATFVTDPDSGEVLAVEHTPEYLGTLRAFQADICRHVERVPQRIRIANGAMQVRNCCKKCGERVGTALSQKDKAWVDSLPWHSEELSTSYENRRRVEWERALLGLARRQYAERGALTQSYRTYLLSDAWKAKRALVMRRCDGTCEGCGVAEATDVHHLHYRHLFNELLFELVGLCRKCHDRITDEDREERDRK